MGRQAGRQAGKEMDKQTLDLSLLHTYIPARTLCYMPMCVCGSILTKSDDAAGNNATVRAVQPDEWQQQA